VLLALGISLVFDILLLMTIKDWWDEYFEEQKEALYGDKKELNLGEFLYVSFSAVGEGFANFIEEMLDTNIIDSIIKWFSEHDIARFILGKILNAFTGGLMSDQLETKPQTIGEKVISGISDGMEQAGLAMLGPIGVVQKIVTGIKGILDSDSWKDITPKTIGEKIIKGISKSMEQAGSVLLGMSGPVQLIVNGIKHILGFWADHSEEVKKWYNEKVAPWFTKEKWTELATKAKNGITEKLDELKQRFNPIKDWYNNNIAPWFTWEKWYNLAQDALDALRTAFENFNFSDLFKTPRVVVDAGQAPYGIGGQGRAPKMDIKWYAGGGFPKVGEIFGMSEAGPELMGTIGNRTAIMNNDQIVESVSQGVASAVSRVMGNQGGSYKLYIDGDELRNVMQQRINRSYNINGE
jgi:hypothetical protein